MKRRPIWWVSHIVAVVATVQVLLMALAPQPRLPRVVFFLLGILVGLTIAMVEVLRRQRQATARELEETARISRRLEEFVASFQKSPPA